eukprot:15356119-Ditylum_brightwellii.AAC.2
MPDVLLQFGKTYTSEIGIDMIEFHVDAISENVFSELQPFVCKAEQAENGLGTNPSVFRADK